MAVQEVRRFVRDVLGRWSCDEPLLTDAEVIASELATNAVVHGRSSFLVSLARGERELRLEVRDASRELPRALTGEPARRGGRGMTLVASLAQASGVRPEADGKTVWATVALG